MKCFFSTEIGKCEDAPCKEETCFQISWFYYGCSREYSTYIEVVVVVVVAAVVVVVVVVVVVSSSSSSSSSWSIIYGVVAAFLSAFCLSNGFPRSALLAVRS